MSSTDRRHLKGHQSLDEALQSIEDALKICTRSYIYLLRVSNVIHKRLEKMSFKKSSRWLPEGFLSREDLK